MLRGSLRLCCSRRSGPSSPSASHWRRPGRASSAAPAATSRRQAQHHGDNALHHGPTTTKTTTTTMMASSTPAAARLADRLRALEQVGDNAPFDFRATLQEDRNAATTTVDAATAPASASAAAPHSTHERDRWRDAGRGLPYRHHQHHPQEQQQETHNLQRKTARAKSGQGTRRRTVTTVAHDTAADDLAVFAEDDVVMSMPLALRHIASSPSSRTEAQRASAAMQELKSHSAKHTTSALESPAVSAAEAQQAANVAWHPSARGVGQDVIDLVTDAFREQREAEVAKRRKVLYELTHPDPTDYTYNGKLVPPPPLNFGRVTDEAVRLGHELIVEQPYSLVRKAGTRANAEAEHIPVSDANTASMLESSEHSTSTAASQRARTTAVAQPHRGRKREDNIFRDHNFFFEINELYQEIVLVGKACAGKSSLLNALLDQNVAKTSSTPNTTRQISFYQSVTPDVLRDFQQRGRSNNLVTLPGGGRQLTFVDMPGFGIEGMSEKWRDAAIELTDAYFGVRRSVNTVLFCIDCQRGLTAGDVKYFEWLENVQGVFYIVLTKCDAVSHTRLSTVMRQIYELITKKRRKFRKVFPFIIPTSAKSGTNIDMLRGLITETSGILPGDKLRDLLQQKRASTTRVALEKEAQRLEDARAQDRAEAKRLFQQAHHSLDTPELAPDLNERTTTTTMSKATESASAARTNQAGKNRAGDGGDDDDDDDIFVPLDTPAPTTEATMSLFIGQRPNEKTTSQLVDGTTSSPQSRRELFLQWRQANPLEYEETPYGKVHFRLNTGMENPLSEMVTFETESTDGSTGVNHDADANGDNTAAGEEASLPVGAHGLTGSTSAVIGLDGDQPGTTTTATTANALPATPVASSTGQVSRFLDALDAFGAHADEPRGRRAAREKEARWRRHYAPRFLAEDGEGRLSEFTAGKKSGPSLVQSNTRVDRRKSEWKARQLKALLQAESPDAPWSSLPRLTQKINALKEEAGIGGRRMRKKDVAAYLKNAGSVTESFEKFEGEVTSAKYMNEVRQAKTLRSQQQMHLNATAKINYRSMPPGLWKEYGKKETHWPTPHVLGRDQDESHRGK